MSSIPWFSTLKGLGSRQQPHAIDFAQTVPYRDICDRYVIDAFGAVHAWFRVRAPLVDVADPGELESAQRQLVNFVNHLPSSVIQVQWNFTTNGDYRDVIAAHGKYQSQYEILNWLRERRVEELAAQSRRRELVRSDLILVISCLPNIDAFGKKSAFKGLRAEFRAGGPGLGRIPLRSINEWEFSEAVEILRTSQEIAEELLGHAGIRVQPMNAYQIADYLYRLFNQELAWDYGVPVTYDYDFTPLNDAWICCEPEYGVDHLKLGSYYHAFVSLHKKPLSTVPFRDVEHLTTGLGFSDVRVVWSVRRLDRSGELRKLQGARNARVGSLKLSVNLIDKLWNPLRRATDREQDANVEANQDVKEINRVIEQMRAGEEYLVAGQMVIHFWAKDPKELSSRRAAIMAKIASLEGARGFPERFATRWICETALPGSLNPYQRMLKVPSRMAADLTPLQGAFEGRGDPVCLLRNSAGGLVGFNLCDTGDVNAPMAFISGSSGSGKSYLMNLLIMQHCFNNSILLALDGSGASCAPVVELMGGKIIRLREDLHSGEAPFCFNPLEVYGQRSKHRVVQEPSDAQVARMATCIYAMILSARPAEAIITASEQKLIVRAINVAFTQAHKANAEGVYMSDLVQLLDDKYRNEAGQLADAIRPFTRGQPLGRWFDGPTTVDLETRAALFDLTGIRKNRPLAGAMIPLLVNYFHDIVTRDPGVTKFVPLDELWEMILNEQLAQMIFESLKAWRKMGAVIIGCSQALKDLDLDERVKNAIRQNTDTWFLLEQGSGDQAQIAADFLKLTSGQYDILTTLRKANRLNRSGVLESYREALLIRGTGENGISGRVRISSTPIEYWLSTTKPEEFTLRRETRERFNGDLAAAIRYLAEKHPGGLHVDKEI